MRFLVFDKAQDMVIKTTVLPKRNICKNAWVCRGWIAVNQTNIMGALAS